MGQITQLLQAGQRTGQGQRTEQSSVSFGILVHRRCKVNVFHHLTQIYNEFTKERPQKWDLEVGFNNPHFGHGQILQS